VTQPIRAVPTFTATRSAG